MPSLSLLSITMATPLVILSLIGLKNLERAAGQMRAFPRSLSWGYALMGLATIWFLYLVKQEDISDFEAYKRYMLIGFAVIGVGTMVYVQDFLSVRGASVLMLLLAKLMVDTARWVDTPARLFLVLWAYLMVLAGMWFTISPWRLRDLIFWISERKSRLQVTLGLTLAWSILILILAMSLYRTAPQ